MLFPVPEIDPKFVLPSALFGTTKFGVFVIFDTSPRSCSFISSWRPKSLKIDMLTRRFDGPCSTVPGVLPGVNCACGRKALGPEPPLQRALILRQLRIADHVRTVAA